MEGIERGGSRATRQPTDDGEEWEALKTMREADAVEQSEVAVLNSIDNNTGASGMENDTIDGESGAL